MRQFYDKLKAGSEVFFPDPDNDKLSGNYKVISKGSYIQGLTTIEIERNSVREVVFVKELF